MTIMLVRHAATSANESGRMAVGTPGPSLSPAGREAASSTSQRYLARALPDRVWVSPAARATETATILFRGRSLEIQPELAEIEPGEWGAPEFAGGTQLHARLMRSWEVGADLALAPPGGESGAAVISRLKPVVHALSTIEDAELVVLVTHFGVIRMLVSAFVHQFEVKRRMPVGFPSLLQSTTLRRDQFVI